MYISCNVAQVSYTVIYSKMHNARSVMLSPGGKLFVHFTSTVARPLTTIALVGICYTFVGFSDSMFDALFIYLCSLRSILSLSMKFSFKLHTIQFSSKMRLRDLLLNDYETWYFQETYVLSLPPYFLNLYIKFYIAFHLSRSFYKGTFSVFIIKS